MQIKVARNVKMKVVCAETGEMIFLLWDQLVIFFGDVPIGCPR